MLGPYLTRRGYSGYSGCAVSSPTSDALRGYGVVGLYFGADWCHLCSEFKVVLEKLYAAQVAQGAHRLEIVLVSRCREAKATKYYGLGMPWLSMCHDANDEVGMKTRTSELMAKFGITAIPALVLLDERGQVICADGCGRCGADPEGVSFPWREQPNRGPGTRAVVNFDLPAGVWAQRPGSPRPPAGSTAASGAPGGPGEQTERPVSPARIRPAS